MRITGLRWNVRVWGAAATGVLVSALLPASPAAAYTYLPGGCSQPGTYVLGVRQIMFRSADITGYTTLSPNSAGRWNAAVTNAKFVAATTSYSVSSSEANLGNVGYDSTTDWACGTGGTFVPVTYVWGNTYYLAGFSNPQRYSVMVHELGHALGLDHNNNHGNCTVVQVMYVSIDRYNNCGVENPKSDDVAGVDALY